MKQLIAKVNHKKIAKLTVRKSKTVGKTVFMRKITIMLGGNLPGTAEAMDEAIKKFADSGVKNIRVSRAVSSPAVDCVPGTPDFLDMGLTGEYSGSAGELLALCQKIEIEAGRPAIHSSRESRILDCDIIFFGDEIIDRPDLTVPHPRAEIREFVLLPLSELIPEQRFPDGKSVAGALAELQNQ